MGFEEKLAELYIDIPEPLPPLGGNAAVVKSGKYLFVAGELPYAEGKLMYKGKLGLNVNVDTATAAARACTINALSHIKKELGSLDNIKKFVRIVGYVASSGEFSEQHKVVEGALKFLKEVFGPAGKPAASAVGVNNLPNGACVMIEFVVEVK